MGRGIRRAVDMFNDPRDLVEEAERRLDLGDEFEEATCSDEYVFWLLII